MRRAWREEAQKAIAALRESKYGDREAELRSLAVHLGFKNGDPSSLRRAIGAHEFLDRLRSEHPESYEHLRGVSLSVAELIARWYAASPEQALKAAKAWSEGRATVQTIRAAMEERMPRGHGGKVGSARQRAFKNSALEEIKSAVARLAVGQIASVSERQRDGASGIKTDFLFEIAGDPPQKLAVLVVGPYKNAAMYRDRCDEWILRAFGSAWIFDRVLLAIPDERFISMYDARAKQLARATEQKATVGAAVPRVDAIYIYVDPMDPEDSAALSEHAP
jgi:hypothetical protein